jgi:hypothetical protein
MFGEKFISRVDKFGMWILLVLILAFFFTGYGMTKHIMDPVLAKYIHGQLLPIPLLIFLCVHVVKAVHNQFKKWKFFNSERVLDLYAYGITLIVAFILIWLYFQ